MEDQKGKAAAVITEEYKLSREELHRPPLVALKHLIKYDTVDMTISLTLPAPLLVHH